MKYNNILLRIILLLNLAIFSNSKSEDDLTIQSLLNWCQKNDIVISTKLKLSFEKGVLEAKALEDIPPREELITIPDKMILTVEKILSKINLPNVQSQYHNFKNIKIEPYKTMNSELYKEEIFLSYLLYLMKNEEENYKDTELFKEYKEFFLFFLKFVSNSPLLYTNEQKEYISGTYFGNYAKNIKKKIDEEINIFKNDSFLNKTVDINDYIHKRLFVINRGYDISQKKEEAKIILVPLYTLLPFDSLIYNARLDYKNQNGAKIISTYNIEEGKSIIVSSHDRINAEKMVFEGRINSRNTRYKENHLIPVYSPYLYYKYDIDDIKLIESHYFNLFENNFIRNSMLYYKIHSEVFKIKKASDLWACITLEENIKYYKDYLENLLNKVDELFKGEYESKVDEINKAIKYELENINKQFGKIVETCENEKKINKDEDNVSEDL